MTNRIVEAKIVLLLWLFSASAISYSVVSQAVALFAEVKAPESSIANGDNSTKGTDIPDGTYPSTAGGGELDFG